MDGSKEQPQVTAGLDLGDKYTYLCLLDTVSGEVIEEGRLRTTPEALKRRFSSEPRPLRIAIEAGTHSPWVSRVLKDCGHEVLVANPRKTRLIYTNKRKTDEIDAENLARLARLDPKLLYPLKHRSEDCQAHMAIIRSREALVGCRTQLVNHIRGVVKSFGGRLPKCPARSFHNKAPAPARTAILCTRMANERTEHSRIGIASFILSFVPGVLLVVLVALILLLSGMAPPGADETGFGFGIIMLVMMTLLSEIVALGLGIAGVLQRRRKRLFASLGIACSVLFMVALFTQNAIFPAPGPQCARCEAESLFGSLFLLVF